MKSIFKKIWLKFNDFDKIQKTLALSIFASLMILLLSIIVNQKFYNQNGTLLVLLLLTSLFIAGCSFVGITFRLLFTGISNNEKLKKIRLINSKNLLIYSSITFIVSLGMILFGLAKNSIILAVILFSLTFVSLLICGLIFMKYILSFKLIRKLIQFSIIGIVVFFFVYLLVGRPYRITGNSMLPTLVNNSYFLSTKLTYYLSEPKRGDIIIFRPPISEDEFIGRIVGLPGETISINDDDVYLSGKLLEEKYLFSVKSTKGGSFLKEKEQFNIPDNNYFVMGDNRENSSDSRAWGPINKSAISGKVWIRSYPLKEFGTKIN
ncbi:MAG: signal peptidase I [Patescibacteria group bacterium]